MEKTDFRSADSNTRNTIRKQVIRLVKSGIQKKKVAEILGVNQNTITNWVKKLKANGA